MLGRSLRMNIQVMPGISTEPIAEAPTESRMPVPPVMPPMTPVRKDSR